MSDNGSVRLEIAHKIARIVIDRPDKRNALSLAMWRSIPALIAEINDNRTVRAVIVNGAGGKSFAAGADINELEDCIDSTGHALAYMHAVESATDAIVHCGKPVIAQIQGFCIGAGLEIAMACDRRIATPESAFAIPPAKLGVTYSPGSTQRLVTLVGVPTAKDLIFTARKIDAEKALSYGLVDEVAPDQDIEATVIDYLGSVMRHSPFSIKATKAVINAMWDGASSDDIRDLRLSGFSSDDFKEGIQAFNEGRYPNYE